MKPKLLAFRTFAMGLLPHEADYVQSVAGFEDHENQDILSKLVAQAHAPNQEISFDEQIDKRKYSRVKKYVQEKLAAIDVDRQYEWITYTEQQIMLDTITPEEEYRLLKVLRTYSKPTYYFTKLYELSQHYRQYLLVRMRHSAHQEVHQFLVDQAEAYQRAKYTYEGIHQATWDIIQQYSKHDTESQQWETRLQRVFLDAQMDGLNRYVAAVRLTFMYLNYREFEKLRQLFLRLDRLFTEGICYSRRLLLNYYSNRLLLHSRVGELEKAALYGYLSIRQQGDSVDYLLYVNNLCAVLLRKGNIDQALSLMERNYAKMRVSPSSHSKVTYATLYMRCLFESGRAFEAQTYAERFLRGYKEAVMSQGWHAFFTAFFEALLIQEKYDVLLKVAGTFKLFYKESQYEQRIGYIPTLLWYMELARYKEGRITERQLIQSLESRMPTRMESRQHADRINRIIKQLSPHAPELFKKAFYWIDSPPQIIE